VKRAVVEFRRTDRLPEAVDDVAALERFATWSREHELVRPPFIREEFLQEQLQGVRVRN